MGYIVNMSTLAMKDFFHIVCMFKRSSSMAFLRWSASAGHNLTLKPLIWPYIISYVFEKIINSVIKKAFLCRWETHGWQTDVISHVVATLAARSHVRFTTAVQTLCVSWTRMEIISANPQVSPTKMIFFAYFVWKPKLNPCFVFSPPTRVWQVFHLGGSALPNVWQVHASFPGCLHLHPYSGPQPGE